MVETKVAPRCTFKVKELRSLVEHLKAVPDFRGRIESYPVWSLLAIIACATLGDAPRGQKDLAAFSKKLSSGQRRALGIRRNGLGQYPDPSQPAFSRLLKAVDRQAVDQAVLAFHRQVRGDPPKEELVVLDGKEPNHGGGHSILTAVTVPSQHYLGSAVVDGKTNEIPVARQLFEKLDLDGRLVSLDALHTQSQTARELVQERGADYLMTVKENQPTVCQNIQTLLPEPPAAFPPEDSTNTHACSQERNKSRHEVRVIRTAPTHPEQVCFPAAAQMARRRRQIQGHKPETVALLTSAPAERVNAQRWLQLNRAHWGIEAGLHQRLDISYNDDLCRVRDANGMGVLGIFRRLANSLCVEWISRQPKLKHLTTTDFATEMGKDNRRRAILMVIAAKPSMGRTHE